MKIAIMSDSHDRWASLEKAVALADDARCEILLFAGDLIAPPGIQFLENFNGKVKFVWGNNEGEKLGMTRKMDASKNIQLCGDIYEDTIDGMRVFMNHYLEITNLAAKSGDYDLCIYGHDHTYFEGKVGETILLNPGAITDFGIDKATFIIFDTQTKQVQKIEL